MVSPYTAAFVGGVLIGAVAAWRLGLPVWLSLDAAALGMLVGQAVGRIGCLINGDAWGGPTGCPCGVVYWHEHALIPPELLGVPTHPYPLYEIVGVAAVLALLWTMRKRRAQPGTEFLIATIGYGFVRFVLTFVRQETVIVFGLQAGPARRTGHHRRRRHNLADARHPLPRPRPGGQVNRRHSPR